MVRKDWPQCYRIKVNIIQVSVLVKPTPAYEALVNSNGSRKCDRQHRPGQAKYSPDC